MLKKSAPELTPVLYSSKVVLVHPNTKRYDRLDLTYYRPIVIKYSLSKFME